MKLTLQSIALVFLLAGCTTHAAGPPQIDPKLQDQVRSLRNQVIPLQSRLNDEVAEMQKQCGAQYEVVMEQQTDQSVFSNQTNTTTIRFVCQAKPKPVTAKK